MIAFLILACVAAPVPDDGTDSGPNCAPNTHLVDGACVLDQPRQEADSGDTAEPVGDASLYINNQTDSTWAITWFCDSESCTLDGVGGYGPGASATFAVFSGQDYYAGVVDEQERCNVSSWFSLDPGEAYTWDVTTYVGTKPEDETFGCQVD